MISCVGSDEELQSGLPIQQLISFPHAPFVSPRVTPAGAEFVTKAVGLKLCSSVKVKESSSGSASRGIAGVWDNDLLAGGGGVGAPCRA